MIQKYYFTWKCLKWDKLKCFNFSISVLICLKSVWHWLGQRGLWTKKFFVLFRVSHRGSREFPGIVDLVVNASISLLLRFFSTFQFHASTNDAAWKTQIPFIIRTVLHYTHPETIQSHFYLTVQPSSVTEYFNTLSIARGCNGGCIINPIVIALCPKSKYLTMLYIAVRKRLEKVLCL